jgi:hypothetical protein
LEDYFLPLKGRLQVPYNAHNEGELVSIMKRAIGRGIPPIFDEAPSKEHGRTGGVYPGKLNPPRLLSKGSQQEARSPAAASLLVFSHPPHFLKT